MSDLSGHGGAPVRSNPAPPPGREIENPLLAEPPPSIQGYTIVGELGRGGMGVVYLGQRDVDGIKVALKVLPVTAGESMVQRFDQEMNIARVLSHPDIVKVYDCGWSDKYAWIAMEVLDGFELWQAMPDRRFTLEERISVIGRVAAALHHAHEHGVVHRDVKPSNIFLTRDGGVRLLDFGIAKMKDVRLTKTGKTVGTPQYMAPEQIMAQTVDGRTDIFSLSSVAYECFAGTSPWTGENDHQLMMAVCTKPATPFKQAFLARNWFTLSEPALNRLHAVIHKGLTMEPTRRFASTLELANALQQVLAPEDGLPTEETRAARVTLEVWAERRIDWARARAARIAAEVVPGESREGEVLPAAAPAASLIQEPDEDADRPVLLWVGLVAVFVIGLVVALALLLR